MSNESECCENCSSSFSLFKRKKTCSLCNQSFCHFCLSRRNSADQASAGNQENQQSQQANERICNTCRTICHPQTTTDDLMKLKLKHLKCVLNKANIPTNTCKDKRDLAELIVRNHSQKFRPFYSPSPSPNPNQPFNAQQQQQQQQQPSAGFPFNNNFNHTLNNLMTNVQDFVNGNIINPTSQARSSSSSSSSTNTNRNQHQQQQQQQQPANNSSSTSSTSTSTSSSSTNTNQQPNTNFTIPNNFTSSVLNFIGEQVPNVIQQTFHNFNFNNSNSNSNSNTTNPQQTNRTNAHRRSSGQATNGPAQPRTNSANFQQQARDTTQQAQQPPRSESSHNQPSCATTKRRASLSDIKSEHDIDQLNIKQIKEILAANFVEYKGCCEKKELVEKIKRLYASNLENKRLEGELNNGSSVGDSKCTSSVLNDEVHQATASSLNSDSNGVKRKPDESDLCKICMESVIECVLLDCGHMCSCIKCGKQLAECPICRQNVVRVIRVFKS